MSTYQEHWLAFPTYPYVEIHGVPCECSPRYDRMKVEDAETAPLLSVMLQRVRDRHAAPADIHLGDCLKENTK